MNPANLLVAGIIVLLVLNAIVVVIKARMDGRNSCGCMGCSNCSKRCQCDAEKPIGIDGCDSCGGCEKPEGDHPPQPENPFKPCDK